MEKSIVLKNIHASWLPLLDNQLDDILEQLPKNITPDAKDIFAFARYPLRDTKVVILGQDPYPKIGDACGLAFSSNNKVIPQSLKNIYKCLLQHNLINEMPSTADLSYWSEQGVVLLNCALTTIIGKSNVHKKLWKKYTDMLIKKLNRYAKVFILWGNFAIKKKKLISVKTYCWTHPSPLAQRKQKFPDCDNFVRTNKYLLRHNLKPIDWNVKRPDGYIFIDETLEYCSSDTEEDTTDINNLVNEQFKANPVYEIPVESVSKSDKLSTYFDKSPDKVIVFTDGSCYPNKKVPEAIAGYASCFALGPYKDTLLYGNIDNKKHYASNIRAEGMAIWKIFKYLAKNKKWKKCVIVTDSDLWVKMFISYMPDWEHYGIDFHERLNPDMTIPMYDAYKRYASIGKEIQFLHIKSHITKKKLTSYKKNSIEYFCYYNNDYVDKMANYARTNLKPGQHLEETVDFE